MVFPPFYGPISRVRTPCRPAGKQPVRDRPPHHTAGFEWVVFSSCFENARFEDGPMRNDDGVLQDNRGLWIVGLGQVWGDVCATCPCCFQLAYRARVQGVRMAEDRSQKQKILLL